MKAVMSCDEVFDVLTRGPFPTGSLRDADLDLHLRACHSCRELAEALRPAVGLFHESLPAEEDVELPAYLGRVGQEISCRDPVGVSVRTPRHWRNTLDRCSSAVLGALAGLAASLVFCLLGPAVGGVGIESGGGTVARAAAGSNPPADADDPITERAGGPSFESLGLPLSCFRVAPAGESAGHRELASVPIAVASAPRDGLAGAAACCTRCHFSSGPATLASRRAVETIAASCTACHGRPSSPSAEALGLLLRERRDRAC